MFKLWFLSIFYLLPIQSFAQIKNPQFKKIVDSLCHKQVPLISINDFKKLDKQNLYILDAREEDEFSVSHLKNARCRLFLV